MTRLFNDPAHFTDEAITGFVAANRRWVRPVPRRSRQEHADTT
jgi:hypothetical protein